MADRLAIDGGNPIRTAPFPHWPEVGPEEEQAVLDVVRSRRWGRGPKVEAFEAQLAQLQTARYAVAVSAGTTALELAYKAVGVGYGDEVIMSPYTFIATPSAAVAFGAVPVFVDIEPDTYQIDPEKIEAAITPRTRAIVAVHVAGGPADMDRILAVAERHGLPVVEDAAQAIGARWQGRGVGSIGRVGTFSFQASKNLNAGEGGAVITNDEQVAEMVYTMHNAGRPREAVPLNHYDTTGYNFRMTEFQGAILLAQMTRLQKQIARREQNGRYLDRRLEEIPGIRPMRRDGGVTVHAFHLYMFRYSAQEFGGRSRDDFLKALQAEGIPCAKGYAPLSQNSAVLKAISGIRGLEAVPDPCPVAERVSEHEGVWLFQTMLLGTQADMDDIVAAVARIQQAWAR